MKKLLAVLALLTLSTLSFAKDIAIENEVIYILDGKKVYICDAQTNIAQPLYSYCKLLIPDYTKDDYYNE
ncbi:hypothetical protein PQZ50_01680 [Methylophilaceae bacterium]|nr:hypothetical protein [Methylophilaceae bacterium]